MSKLTEKCIAEINHAQPITDYLDQAPPKYPKEYACPFCDSKHHVTVYKETNTACCMKCRVSFDLIRAKETREGRDFLEAAKAIAEREGIRLEYEEAAAGKKHTKAGAAAAAPDPTEKTENLIADPEPAEYPNTPGKYAEDIKQWAAKVDAARDYLHGRSITDEIIKQHLLGFGYFYFKEAKENLPAVVFPYSGAASYYAARSIDGKYFCKPKREEAGSEPIYNAAALENGRPVFITEGQFDALSVAIAGGNACAICGAGHNKLLKAITKKTGPVILFLDRDEVNDQGHRPGQEAQAKIAAALEEKNIPYREIVIDYTRYTGPAKDANDLLRANPEQFKKDIKANEKAAADTSGIDAFLLGAETEKYKPIPTGIKSIDRLLKGGFIPQSLILLGGAAGTGKTLLACLIFETMAAAGRYCIYLNLEMAREQLIARSIARRVYAKNKNYRLTALDILQGYKWTDTQREIITAAAEEYRAEMAGRFEYNPGNATANLDAILEDLEAAGAAAIREGRPAPCVCLDYLHLLTGRPGEEPAAVLKRAVSGLKEYAIKYNTVVFAIQATSREANKAPEARLDAGRDTSALEYSGDLVLQLKRNQESNILSLCVVKSRFTETNIDGEKYILHGGQSYMEPIPEEWSPVSESVFDNAQTAI